MSWLSVCDYMNVCMNRASPFWLKANQSPCVRMNQGSQPMQSLDAQSKKQQQLCQAQPSWGYTACGGRESNYTNYRREKKLNKRCLAFAWCCSVSATLELKVADMRKHQRAEFKETATVWSPWFSSHTTEKGWGSKQVELSWGKHENTRGKEMNSRGGGGAETIKMLMT